METKKQFKSLEEIYNSKNYFWQYGRYLNYYKLIFISSKPQLVYKSTDNSNWEVIATGLKQINKMMLIHNLEVEY